MTKRTRTHPNKCTHCYKYGYSCNGSPKGCPQYTSIYRPSDALYRRSLT